MSGIVILRLPLSLIYLSLSLFYSDVSNISHYQGSPLQLGSTVRPHLTRRWRQQEDHWEDPGGQHLEWQLHLKIWHRVIIRWVVFIISNILYIVVMPVPSTWGALSSWQEDSIPAPQCLSTTRLAMWGIFLHFNTIDGAMGAAPTTMREPR